MAEAAARAPARPTWILALRQTAGRGRRGRVWVDPGGNFAATLALPLRAPAPQAALYSFVAALALHDALSGLVAPDRLALKWPNDVLLDDGKLSGILLESMGQGAAVTRLAIGIGVNLAAAPPPEPEAVPPVSLLGATGHTVMAEAFLDRLAPAFAARQAQFQAAGFGPIRAEWLARAARLGQRVTARTTRETLSGVFETLDPGGALVLATAQGRRLVPAGEVFF
ncbi:biotin--[acetyl-CoA-carboxylase] ligase [Rhodobaculum claviforme]|uniref:biotin--[biotin carboxyl-carrier protein] ligase n=1 Tax=Rhodobaculum claviforme TaxID=1549854 RepID=A0A934WKA0_9RHOB|nr:biotin--[acetyl-CoA-carboxylase] ligase [Rhodobaculum claviforme]MBK5928772.1 biotin--[acetyl-CoA-carboxylase] ligase [Rhodobaculum claviforme]